MAKNRCACRIRLLRGSCRTRISIFSSNAWNGTSTGKRPTSSGTIPNLKRWDIRPIPIIPLVLQRAIAYCIRSEGSTCFSNSLHFSEAIVSSDEWRSSAMFVNVAPNPSTLHDEDGQQTMEESIWCEVAYRLSSLRATICSRFENAPEAMNRMFVVSMSTYIMTIYWRVCLHDNSGFQTRLDWDDRSNSHSSLSLTVRSEFST